MYQTDLYIEFQCNCIKKIRISKKKKKDLELCYTSKDLELCYIQPKTYSVQPGGLALCDGQSLGKKEDKFKILLILKEKQ